MDDCVAKDTKEAGRLRLSKASKVTVGMVDLVAEFPGPSKSPIIREAGVEGFAFRGCLGLSV